MPRLEHHAGGGLTLLRPTQDEAVLGRIGLQPLVGAGVGEAGVLLKAVRCEDVGGVAGGVLAGLRRGLDGSGLGGSVLFLASGLPVALDCGLIGALAGGGVRVKDALALGGVQDDLCLLYTSDAADEL